MSSLNSFSSFNSQYYDCSLPFDPDNPVPKGVTLRPADLRAKYCKVIDPKAKFYVGDPRLQRDRTRERDPRRTVHFKNIGADPQEVFEYVPTNQSVSYSRIQIVFAIYRTLLVFTLS